MASNRQWEEQGGVELARHELAPTAERIIRASRRILVKKGYSKLTMQEITKESGVNRALVSYYFGSKAGLVEALVETLFEDPAFGYSDDVVLAPEGEPRRRALFAWLGRIVQDRRSGRLLYELLPHFLRSPRLSAHVAELYSAYRKFDGHCLASGVSGLDQGDQGRIGALSVAVVEGLGIQLAVDRHGFDEAGAYALWEEMVDAYLVAKERAAQGPSMRRIFRERGCHERRGGQSKQGCWGHRGRGRTALTGRSQTMTQGTDGSSGRLSGYAALRGRHFVTDQDYSAEELRQHARSRDRPEGTLEAQTADTLPVGRDAGDDLRAPVDTHASQLRGRDDRVRRSRPVPAAGRDPPARPREHQGHGSCSLRLCDAIEARTAYHRTLVELAEWATVPVVNGLTDDYDHPVQSMTDVLTMLEHAGRLDGLSLAFLGKCSDAMCTSVALTCSRLGGQHGSRGAAAGADGARDAGARARQLLGERRLPDSDRRPGRSHRRR